MGVNINYFKKFTEYAANKSQSGDTISPSQFNMVANQAQLQLFENDFQTYLQTEEISEYLKIYLLPKVEGVPNTGELPYPEDYLHLASLRKYYNGKMIPIEEVKNEAWGFIQISSLMKPSLRFPKYNEFSNVIRFLPKSIGIIEIDYFKKPTIPVWGYINVAGQPVYNPATSTNFDWIEYSFNEIASIFLSIIGINLRAGDLAQWSQQFKQENKSLL